MFKVISQVNCLILLCLLLLTSCSLKSEKTSELATENQKKPEFEENLRKSIKAVEPFFQTMGEPQEYDWLANFNESGQTFEEYIAGTPNIPQEERKIIYIQPLGKFTEKQKKIVETSSEFLSAFFLLEVKLLEEKKFEQTLPANSYRIKPSNKARQIRTGYIMDELLKPNLKNDAVALISFTNEDLYPDETMSFVFGQANLQERVGVWSLYHLADPKHEEKLLLRALKLGAHETGHIFSMAHCTKYSCVMSGTNHLGESDRRPLDACPECMAKICWMNRKTPKERYQKLLEFCRKQGLNEEAKMFEEKLKAVSF